MTTESTPPRTGLATAWLAAQYFVLSGCAVALLGYWHRVLDIYMHYGQRQFYRWLFYYEHRTFWKVTALALVALVVGTLLARRLAAQRTGGTARWVWPVLGIWFLMSLALWLATASPISREPTLSAGFAAASWWLLWPWLSRFTGWSGRARLAGMAALVGVALLFVANVRFDGLDGDSQANFVWRFRATNDRAAPSSRVSPTTPPPTDVGTTAPARADSPSDYPRYRGPDGQGTVRGAHLERDWSKRPPVERWRHPVGIAWSAFAVAGDHAITQEQRGEEECVVCYHRDTGRELWVHKDPAHYVEHATGDGPRATPAVAGQRVYTYGGTGILNCLDRATGQRLWTVDTLKDNDAPLLRYGMCGSPLVVGDVVIVCPGGVKNSSLVAYHLQTGAKVWHAGDDEAAYASPALVRLGDTDQVISLNKATLESRNPQTGELIWATPWWKDVEAINCSQVSPLEGDKLFLSTGYGKGATLYQLTPGPAPWKIEPLWKSRDMQTKFCTAVIYQGHAYGMDNGILACISLKNGKKTWKKGRYGHGQLLLADDLILVQAEDGKLVLVEANPEKHRELANLPVLAGKTWNHPALAGNQLFLRNDHEAVCLELPVSESRTALAP